MSNKTSKSHADRKLKMAATMAAQAYLDEQLQRESDFKSGEETEQHEFSEEFLQSMDAIFREEEKQIYNRRRRNIMRMAAMIAIIVIGGGAVAGGNAEALKLKFFNNYIKKETKHSEFFENEGSAQMNALRKKYPKMYFPDSIPDGMKAEVQIYDEKNERYYLHCQNNEQYIFVSQTQMAKTLFDTEDTEMNHAKRHGIVYYWTEDDDGSTITWKQDGYRFALFSSYDCQFAFSIAESLK